MAIHNHPDEGGSNLKGKNMREVDQSRAQSFSHFQKEDWLLVVLFAHHPSPVRGKTRLVKELFLLGMESIPEIEKAFSWKPHIYGPYAPEIYQVLEELQSRDLIHVEMERPNSVFVDEDSIRYDYSLTPKGLELARDRWNEFPTGKQEALKQVVYLSNRLGLLGLLHYVYTTYPRMAVASEKSF